MSTYLIYCTTLFQRSSNVIWTLWTLEGRWSNVVCHLDTNWLENEKKPKPLVQKLKVGLSTLRGLNIAGTKFCDFCGFSPKPQNLVPARFLEWEKQVFNNLQNRLKFSPKLLIHQIEFRKKSQKFVLVVYLCPLNCFCFDFRATQTIIVYMQKWHVNSLDVKWSSFECIRKNTKKNVCIKKSLVNSVTMLS